MSNLWRLTSWKLTMFAPAQDYNTAIKKFKAMLGRVINRSKEMVLLDEIIEISRLDENGKEVDTDSGLEFTEQWLKDLGVGFEIINLIEH